MLLEGQLCIRAESNKGSRFNAYVDGLINQVGLVSGSVQQYTSG
jgi:hypothetical protein